MTLYIVIISYHVKTYKYLICTPVSIHDHIASKYLG